MQFGEFFFDGDKKKIYEAPGGFSYVLDGEGYMIYTPDDPSTAPQSLIYTTYELWSRYVDYMDAIEWATKVFSISGGAFRFVNEYAEDVFALIDIRLVNDWAYVPANYAHTTYIKGNLFPNEATNIDFDTDRISVQGVSPRINFSDVGERTVTGATDSDLQYIPKAIYVDTEALLDGIGTQKDPFNNINSAKDFLELSGIKNIYLSGSVIVPANLKNVYIYGIGLPEVDLNGQDIKNTRFHQVRLKGDYTSELIAQECVLIDGFSVDGYFQDCDIAGEIIARSNTKISLIDCLSDDGVFNMNSALPTNVSIHGHRGKLTVSSCDHVDDVITVNMDQGSLTFDNTCTLGTLTAGGTCKFTNEANGATVIDETVAAIIYDTDTSCP